MPDSYPRQQARTRRFTLGVPRTFTVSREGRRVLFLRSPSGTDPATALWCFDPGDGRESLVVDPVELDGGGDPTPEERARRERRRERAAGITAYSADAEASRVVFALNGELWITDVVSGATERLDVPGPVFDPRIDAAGGQVAWCRRGELWAMDLGDRAPRLVVGPEADDGTVTWGQAEFVAAEEMHRDRGHWWLEGGDLLAARVDVSPVGVWWVADPAHPDRAPVPHRYPAAGTPDAAVTLWQFGPDGTRREVIWDRAEYPYLVVVCPGPGAPLVVVERRDHHECLVLEVELATGSTRAVGGQRDTTWVDWPVGLPARLEDGRMVWTAPVAGSTALTVDEQPITPAGLEVRAVVGVGAGVVFTASSDPTRIELYRWSGAGLHPLAVGGVVTGAAGDGPTIVRAQRRMAEPGVRTEVTDSRGKALGSIRSLADTPMLEPSARMLSIGPDELRTGVVLPRDHRPGTKLPVLVLPYGGPGAQMVLADHHAWLDAQWRADQGFAVVTCDGRGTPGRGRSWDRRAYQDLSEGILEDQITALQGAAAEIPDLDLGRVGITGWSFGGYLSALAVLRRPDIFHVAVAGAPVTDWRLYDTYYTERYLGHPEVHPDVYDRQSLLVDAPRLTRPLLLIHGLVDDNVVVAHSLQLSQRLLEAGRPHAVIPLTGVTHMASQEDVAENLLLLQTRFLADALGVPTIAGAGPPE